VSFVPWALVAAMRTPRPDVVVASSPPLTAGAAGAAVAAARGARFVFEVRDLWPESAAATGLVSDPRLVRAMEVLARMCERRADRAVALTEGIRDGLVARGMNPARISLITNGADLDLAPNGPAPVPVPDGAFVAMFVGQHGTYGALHTVLDAADRLRGDRRVRFVLVGSGDRKAALVEEAERRGLANVSFVDPVPRREVPAWLARADVCLLPYQDRPLFAGALPNKTFDYLGAARPIVAAVPEGELSTLVSRAACGIPVPPEDGAAMAAAIRRLADDPEEARRMGAAGGAYVREHYDRADLADRFVSLVEGLA
jgi:glycosyltransferase involved in cell wall biosynthesis